VATGRRADQGATGGPCEEDLEAKAAEPARESLRMHARYRGKIETALRCPVRSAADFSLWYSPGVAAPCLEIRDDPEKVYEYTSKWNTIAVVSDGTRVLGLGDIGPKAGLPVMEGKALLFKYLGGVDCVPLMLDTKDPDEIIRTVLMLQPSFGGINLEDISQPKCFRILDTLRAQAEIPVWHDDQQGTATVLLAGLLNALKVVGKRMEDVRITFVGSGAANVACARLVFARGGDAGRCLMVDTRGILGHHRDDICCDGTDYGEKRRLCEITNAEGRRGGIAAALEGADVLISCAAPGPGTIQKDWIRGMATDPVVFACANPIPEIWPWEAQAAGAAVIGTGRSDFPNQVNNSLCFPGMFRGALDVRARTITDGMCFAAADALAAAVREPSADNLLPTMGEWQIFAEVAAAVGMEAQRAGVARLQRTREELVGGAAAMISRSRELAALGAQGGMGEPAALGMVCTNRIRNRSRCTCESECERRGLCCECVSYHRGRGELPQCLDRGARSAVPI
jgi:malate dehydrogenase (oxaloacetate-decarboxylating)